MLLSKRIFQKPMSRSYLGKWGQHSPLIKNHNNHTEINLETNNAPTLSINCIFLLMNCFQAIINLIWFLRTSQLTPVFQVSQKQTNLILQLV